MLSRPDNDNFCLALPKGVDAERLFINVIAVVDATSRINGALQKLKSVPCFNRLHVDSFPPGLIKEQGFSGLPFYSDLHSEHAEKLISQIQNELVVRLEILKKATELSALTIAQTDSLQR